MPQTTTKMGTGCQRNGYWLATNHLSSPGLCRQSGRCAGRGCAL